MPAPTLPRAPALTRSLPFPRPSEFHGERHHVPCAGGQPAWSVLPLSLLRRIAADFMAALTAVHLADLGAKKSRDSRRFRSQSPPSTAGSGWIFSCPSRRWPAECRRIRSASGFPAFEELPRVGGKALDVAALPLGVQRIQGQAALAAPAEAAEDHQLAVRNIQVDPLEVVDLDSSGMKIRRIAPIFTRLYSTRPRISQCVNAPH